MLSTSGPCPEVIAVWMRVWRSAQPITSSDTSMPDSSVNFSRRGVSTSLSFSRLVPWLEAPDVSDPCESLVALALDPEPQAARTAAVAAVVGAGDRSVGRRIGGLLGGAVMGERSQSGTVEDCRSGRYGETGA